MLWSPWDFTEKELIGLKAYSTEQLIDRWEHQRDIKNLMGKYVNDLMLDRDAQLFDKYWAKQAGDVCFGLNDGWYLGAEAVRRYYDSSAEYIGAVNRALRAQFPQQTARFTEEQSYGIGTFRVNPLSAAVVEVADDEQTAKGLWCCFGSKGETKTCGPTSSWLFGYYAVDFIREEDDWKIWHMQYLLDVDCTCGQSWGKAHEPYPERPEFEALKRVPMAEPTRKAVLREMYSPGRALVESPRLPEPYATFSETFSYGTEVQA